MLGRYCSFDLRGCHFIVLVGNERPEGWKKGYLHFNSADQVAWWKDDLAKTPLNSFVLPHQSF